MSIIIDHELTPHAVLNVAEAQEWLTKTVEISEGISTLLPEKYQSPASMGLYLPADWTVDFEEPGTEQYYINIETIQELVRAAQELRIMQVPDNFILHFMEDSSGWFYWKVVGQRYGNIGLVSELNDLEDFQQEVNGVNLALHILQEATRMMNIIFSEYVHGLQLMLAESCKDAMILNRLADSDSSYIREAVLQNPNSSDEAKTLATLRNMN